MLGLYIINYRNLSDAGLLDDKLKARYETSVFKSAPLSDECIIQFDTPIKYHRNTTKLRMVFDRMTPSFIRNNVASIFGSFMLKVKLKTKFIRKCAMLMEIKKIGQYVRLIEL